MKSMWWCLGVFFLVFEVQLMSAQATTTPAPTITPVPWPTMTVVAGQAFPGMPPFPTPVDAEYVPNGFEALSRPHLWALVIHLAEVGVLWHTWLYTRFDAYLTPLEAITFFFLVWFTFRRKFAKYVGALVPNMSAKSVATDKSSTSEVQALVTDINEEQETDKA